MNIWDLCEITKEEYQIGKSVMRKIPKLKEFMPILDKLEDDLRDRINP